MPSTVIHMAVNKRIASKLNINNTDYFVGGISPDISKLVGDQREYSHFCDEPYGAPNIDKFLYKYKNFLNKPFILGYFVHLYTDYLFETYFVPSFLNESRDVITKIDGSKFKCNEGILKQYIYNDYTDLNIKLINKYKLDFKFIENGYDTNNKYIEEIPIDKLYLLFDKTKEIVENSSEKKDFLFNIKDIISFVDFSSNIISQKIISMNVDLS